VSSGFWAWDVREKNKTNCNCFSYSIIWQGMNL